MDTFLNLPRIDEDLLEFVQKHPTDISITPEELKHHQVGLKYRGIIYRVIRCESMYETTEVTKFLLNTGYARLDTATPPYRLVFEIVD